MELNLNTPITTLRGNKLISPFVDRSKFDEDEQIDVDSLPSEDLYTWGDVIEQALTSFEPTDKSEQLLVQSLAGKLIGEEEAELTDDLAGRLERVLEQVTKNEGDDGQGLSWWITAPLLEALDES